MKYIITRTSAYISDLPHKDAKREVVKYLKDVRKFNSLEAWKVKFPKDFDNDKVIETGYTKNNLPYRVYERYWDIYTIEIDNLLKFIEENGQVVISPPENEYVGYESLFTIEIYDDYRE